MASLVQTRTMVAFASDKPGLVPEPWQNQTRGQRDLVTQLVISCVLGLGAFFAFCVCLLYPLVLCLCLC